MAAIWSGDASLTHTQVRNFLFEQAETISVHSGSTNKVLSMKGSWHPPTPHPTPEPSPCKNKGVGAGIVIDHFSLNGQCTTDISVAHGATVALSATWANTEQHCPGCIEQLYIGLK